MTALQILTVLYSLGQKLPQFAALLQPFLDAFSDFVTGVTALFYGRSAAALETEDEVRGRLTDEEKAKLAEVEGLAGRSGIGDWLMKLLALAEKYPALVNLLFTFLPKK